MTEKGEVWLWVGDGDDEPESLACPVLVEPEHLRDWLRRIEVLEKLVEAGFREGVAAGVAAEDDGCADQLAAWLSSETRAALEGAFASDYVAPASGEAEPCPD